MTPRDLIARAEARPSYRVRVFFRYLIGRPLRRYPPPSSTPALAAVSVATVACIVAGLWIGMPDPGPSDPVPPFEFSVRPSPLQLPAAGDRQDGRTKLLGLAGTIAKAGDATQMPVHVQVWDRDAPDDTHGYIARDEHRWFDADGTRHLRVTQLAPQRANSLIAIPSTDPGTDGTAIAHMEPFPTDIGEVATALSARDENVLHAFAEFYRTVELSSGQRSDIFRVLAETEVVVGLGVMADRFGRRGLAFTADTDGGRDLIIVEQSSGALLAFEQYEIDDPSQPPQCTGYLIFFTASAPPSK